MTDTTQIENWAKAVTDASPDLNEEAKRIVVNTYRLLSGGAPVAAAQIAEAAGVPADLVDQTLRSWPLVLRDDDDRIVGFWGIHIEHIEPTHSMTLDGKTVYGWCALDTLFIPEILDRTVQVRSTDHLDGTPIRVTVGQDGLSDVDPPETVVSFLLPDEGEKFTESAVARFCHKIYFFASQSSADKWIGDRTDLHQLPVDDAYQLAKAINRHRLGPIEPAARHEKTR